MEVLFHLDRMTMSLNKKVNFKYHSSSDFLNSLSLDENLVLHGEISEELVVQHTSITNILMNTFGDYVLQVCEEKRKIFISSSSASLNFLKNGKLHSEEEILKLMEYSDKYLNEVEIHGICYASKQNMFNDEVKSLLPGSVLILDNNNICVYSASWFDCYTAGVFDYSLFNSQTCIENYFKDKSCTLLTSGGVDTAYLLHCLKDVDPIDFVSYRLEETGGNNAPEDAKNLLGKMYAGKNIEHATYQLTSIKPISRRLRLYDVDEHLCTTRNLIDKEVYIISGQNSDSIIAPGFVKGDSLVSYFKNWGTIDAFKALIVNYLLYAYQNKLMKGCLSLTFTILNPIVLRLTSRKFEFSSWGFYAGLQNSIPFLIGKTECKLLRKNYSELEKNYVGADKESWAFLIYLRQYTYCLADVQNQRGTSTSGYRFVLPFQNAQFIGYSVNKKSQVRDIVSPKNKLIAYLSRRVPNLALKFYNINEKTRRV